MRRSTACAALLLAMGLVFAAQTRARPQELGPGEPEIVLPSVLLDLEDLSVEQVTAAIPEEPENLPSDLKLPLPDAGAAAIREPEVELQMPKAGFEREETRRGRDFTAEAELGAGTLDHFYGRFSLYSLGQKPEGRILFLHETLDGFSGRPRGRGYHMRTDQLEGGLSIGAKSVRFDSAGSFSERERGLQENGTFYSKIDRFVDLRGDTELVSGKRLWMKASVGGAATTRVLTGGGAASGEITEYLFEPGLAFEYRFRSGALGVAPRASYRGLPDRASLSAARAEARAYLRIDLNEATRLDGGVGWHYGDTTGNSVPFDLGLESDITDWFALGLRGGYRVEEMNLRNLFTAYPLMDMPSALPDGKGWFFAARANWIPAQGWAFNAGILYADSSAMPSFDRTPDLASGLFPFVQEDALRVSVETGLRWNISEALSARLGWTAELARKPEFTPLHRFVFEGDAAQKKGKYGGGLTAEYLLGVNDADQLPTLGVSGFVQAAEFMRFTLEANDLLYPLLDGPRFEWAPFVAAGFTVTLKALINF